MKRIYFLIFSTVICLNLMAQEKRATISWEKTVYNFGEIKEEDGVQTATFKFYNTGSEPLIIQQVRAGCGCTTPDWTREPVQPGESGFVNVAYNPRGRPGRINRTARVTTNATEPNTVLRIQGEVIPREKGLEDYYPRVFGNLRLSTSHMAFAGIKNTQIVTDTVRVVNMGKEDVELDFHSVPNHITIKSEPKILKGKNEKEKHGGKANIIITYDGSNANDWGFITSRIFLVKNGERFTSSRLSVSATIEEDFSHLSEEEMENAPKIEFDDIKYDFGTLKSGEKINHNFVFRNTGKSDLVIRRIRTTCGCTATNPERMVIKPGEESHITVTFNSRGQRGRQNRPITVISNDPNQSSYTLRVTGTVEN